MPVVDGEDGYVFRWKSVALALIECDDLIVPVRHPDKPSKIVFPPYGLGGVGKVQSDAGRHLGIEMLQVI